jgi:hypothetical protein
MNLDALYKNGWILYCPECSEYLGQSDPQNFSGRKQVVIDDLPCETCEEIHKEDINDAQALMGRLGTPKETK